MKKLTKLEGACAVIALRYAADVPDDTAIETCLSQGMFDVQWMTAARKLGLKLHRVIYRKIMLKRFIKKYPEGMYLLGTHNHLFAVKDGKIFDPHWNNAGLSRMVIQAFRVIK